MLLSFLWKKRKSNRTQSVVLGDDDEHLMVLPSDTATWVVAKFNEMTGKMQALEAELDVTKRTLRSRNSALAHIRDFVRPYVSDPAMPYAKKVFYAAVAEVQELPS